MNDEINYKNNPLHGVSLKNILIEMVDYYGFDILFAYLKINCFKTNPSIESSVKFLKKTEWAREKVEGFYLYEYKSLPRASYEQFQLPPRDRIVPEDQIPGEPKALNLEDAERLHEKRAKKAAERGHSAGRGSGKKYGDKRGGTSSNYGRSDNYGQSDNRGEEKVRESDSASSDASGGNASDPWAKWR